MSAILRAEQKSHLIHYQDSSERWLNSLSATLQTQPQALQALCRQWRTENKALVALCNSLRRDFNEARREKRHQLRLQMRTLHHTLSVRAPALRHAQATLQSIERGDTAAAYAQALKLGKHLLGKAACETRFCGQMLSSPHLEQRKVALDCLQNAAGWPHLPVWVDALLAVDSRGSGLQSWLGVFERDSLVQRRAALRQKVLRLVGAQLEKEERDMLVRFL